MKFLKNNFKIIIGFIIGSVLTGGIVYASMSAGDIIYKNNKTVEQALNQLYSYKANVILVQENISGSGTTDVDVKPFYTNYSELTAADFKLIITNMSYANSGTSSEKLPTVTYDSSTGIAKVTPGYMGWGGKGCSAWNTVSLYIIKQ